MAKKKSAVLSAREKQFLNRQKVCRIATADAANTPHNVPVCHVVVGSQIYFATDPGTKKLHNLEKNPTAALEADEYSDNWSELCGLMVIGTARFLKKGKTFQDARKALYKKYPQYKKQQPIEEGATIIIELTPKHTFSWGI